MPSSEAQRTLVKSPPELWAELSDPDSLARHLGELGEIRVTHVEPESIVEWAAQDVRGTVQIKPAGWGTRVTLTVVREAPEQEVVAAVEPEADVETEPEVDVAPEAKADVETEAELEPKSEPRRGFFARIFRRRRSSERPAPETAPPPPPAPALEGAPDLAAELAGAPDLAAELARVEAAMTERDAVLLTAVLDRLGAAHHRPFSRA